jgi:hypothetical protein
MVKKIAIVGKANSGKNTVANLISKNLNSKCKLISFADPLKKIVEIMFPNLPKKFLYGKSKYRSEIIPGAYKNGIPLSVRQLLIDIGNDFGRQYSNEIWINSLDNKVSNLTKLDYSVIVTDVRYRNEFNYLKSNNFSTIKIVRKESLNINHISEIDQDSIDNSEYDYILDNNSSLIDLRGSIINIIDTL